MMISSLVTNKERPDERSPGVGCEYSVKLQDMTLYDVKT